jgi:hypothetical protein
MDTKKKRASGAGVKPDDGVSPLDRKQIRIDPESDAILSKIGGGNLSLGIREAARRLVENKDAKPFSATRHAKRRK